VVAALLRYFSVGNKHAQQRTSNSMKNTKRSIMLPIRPLIATIVLHLLVSVSSAATRVQTINFKSQTLNAELPYNVVLPSDYFTSTTTRYPVLFLLHGLTGHYNDWLLRTNVADYSSQYRIIVVMPEGNDSWYTDTPTEKYETYVVKDLLTDVQQRYRTIEARYGRAIAGLSMGGYGAFKFALKYPATFAFAGSMSGAFNATRLTQTEGGSAANWNNYLKVWGPPGSDARKANDLFELIKQLTPSRIGALPYFYFDCGTEDAAWIFDGNRELSSLMLEKKIPHEYRELPGNHSWVYWDAQVQEVLKIASQKLRLPAPSSRRVSN
jgi:S-formylglutathione hydrolase FrmB